jgi:DNA-binding transcriptional LysR family regulator
MELRHLTTFRTVAKALSFTRAASRSGYAQLSVTDTEAST